MDRDDETHLSALPPEIASLMRAALDDDAEAPEPSFAEDAYPGMKVVSAPPKARNVDAPLREAFEAANFPDFKQSIPQPEQLDPIQRALAELVADRPGLVLHRFAIPQATWDRRRWLGIDPPGVLESTVDYEVDGEPA